MKTGAYAAEADVNGLDVTAVPKMPVAAMGVVSASLRAVGNSQDSSIAATGTVQASNLSYNGLTADQASADVPMTVISLPSIMVMPKPAAAVLISAAPMM